MLPIERRNEILSKLMLDGKVIVSDLSLLYDVTEETIRRDLDKLEKGSEVKVSCKYGEYKYVVYDKIYMPEKDNFITNNSGDNLILTGICSDFSGHSGERLYVYAKCKGEV